MLRRFLILSLLALAGCNSQSDARLCGGAETPTGNPPPPIIGNFPKLTHQAQNFPIAGSRFPESAVIINNGTQVVPLECDRFWSTTVDLVEGSNSFELVTETFSLNRSLPVSFSIFLDTQPPDPPSINPLPATTALGSIAVSGTREAGATVYLNGLPLILPGNSTSFSADVPLPLFGINTLLFTQKDAAGNLKKVDDGTGTLIPAATTVTIDRTSAVGIAPSLNYPLHRQRVAPLPRQTGYQLIWNQLAGIGINYRIQIAPSPAFASLLLDVTTAAASAPFTPAQDGTFYWRVGTVDAVTTAVTWGLSRSFTSGFQPADINGDGLVDMALGAPGGDANPTIITNNQGRIDLFLGKTDLGISGPESAFLSLSGIDANGELGIAVTAGDLNGDGFADIIGGAHRMDANERRSGAALMFLGSATPDANHDLIYPGQTAEDGFGSAVHSGFDLNADGYDDLAIGAWLYDLGGTDQTDNRGRIYVFFGGADALSGLDAVPDLILTGSEPEAHFGSAITGGFDLNGDGYDDLAVGAPRTDNPDLPSAIDGGSVTVYFGGPNVDGIADWQAYGLTPDAHLGAGLGNAGDMTGDGFDTLAAGAPAAGAGLSPSIGQLFLFNGGIDPDNLNDRLIPGSAGCESFGFAISGGGDLNGDGLTDLALGVPFSNTGSAIPGCQSTAGDHGMVEVHFGAAPLGSGAIVRFTGAAANDRLGFGVHLTGDVNGDGLDDLLSGAPNNDESSQLFGDSGRGYLLFGPGAGTSWVGTRTITVTGTNQTTVSGAILAGQGDKDGMGTSAW